MEHPNLKLKSGWWFEHLWKIWKSIGMIIPNIWENKKWQPNHQPEMDDDLGVTCPNEILAWQLPSSDSDSFSRDNSFGLTTPLRSYFSGHCPTYPI